MFRSPLDLRGFDPSKPQGIEPDEWVVLGPLVWDDGDEITVPRGFITDLASVPRALRALPGLNPNGPSRAAGVLHDYLYCAHTLDTREAADALFRKALRSLGVGPVTARVYWLGVRAGGWLYWNKRRQHGTGIL